MSPEGVLTAVALGIAFLSAFLRFLTRYLRARAARLEQPPVTTQLVEQGPEGELWSSERPKSPPPAVPSAKPAPARRVSVRTILPFLPQRVLLEELYGFLETKTSIPIGLDALLRPAVADLASDFLHCGLYGVSRCGKDQLLRVWFLVLAERNSPEDVQFAVLDGKGDWLTPDLAQLAHFFLPPAGGYGEGGRQSILKAIKAIDREAERRQKLIFGSGARTREQYNRKHPDQRLPLLVVFATDVIDLTTEVEGLLVSLVSKAAALGIRVVVSMQTPTGRGLEWRANLSTVIAGSLVDGSQDAPALGIRDVSSLVFRPSEIPPPPAERGVFALRIRGDQALVRTPLFAADSDANEDEFDRRVALLPRRNEQLLGSLLAEEAPAGGVTSGVMALESPKPDVVTPLLTVAVTPEEAAFAAQLLTSNVAPSEVAKRLRGYTPTKYREFRAKVDAVAALLKQTEEPL